MRIPPASVLCRPPTVDDIRRWPDYFISGPGREVAGQTRCRHDYLLTSTCPGCDADYEATGLETGARLDRTGVDRVTDVIAVYRKPDAFGLFEVWVNGEFHVATGQPGNTVMNFVRQFAAGQVVVRYEDDDSLIERTERRAVRTTTRQPIMQRAVIEPGDTPPVQIIGDGNPLARGAFWDGRSSLPE